MKWNRRVGWLALIVLVACATNPVTGKRQLVLMSEAQEIEMGRESAPQIAASMGIYDDAALQRYVESVGMPMAKGSERPNLPWQFQVVDDSLVNAFAVPGGFLYVTRGILAHMNSEAELAGVLGHEIGHVTARHSVAQYTKSMGAQLVLLPAALIPELSPVTQLLGTGMQVLLLKYSRDDERQSDELGVRYMTKAGYDAEEMVKVFATLGRIGAKSGADGLPEWLSSHPNPGNRQQLIRAQIARLPGGTGREVGRQRFLEMIDGIVYGNDPRQGFFDAGNVFHHPELAFRVDFPAAWPTVNQRQLVGGVAPEQDALLQLTLAQQSTAEAAATAFRSQQGLQSTPPQSGRIGGLPAVTVDFAASGAQGSIRGVVAFVEHGGRVFRLLGYAGASGFAGHEAVLRKTLGSFARETSSAVLSVEPWRIDVVTPRQTLSVEAFARTYPGPGSADELALMNGIPEGGSYPAGVAAKRVVGKPLP
jgi:predicted Zn-dependent protease